ASSVSKACSTSVSCATTWLSMRHPQLSRCGPDASRIRDAGRSGAPAASAWMLSRSLGRGRLDREQQQKGDQERENAQGFGHGETEDQVTALAGSSRRVAQRTREEVAEDVGHADGGARHAEAGDAGTNELCGFSFHVEFLSKPWKQS